MGRQGFRQEIERCACLFYNLLQLQLAACQPSSQRPDVAVLVSQHPPQVAHLALQGWQLNLQMLDVQIVTVSGVELYLACAALACVEFLGMLIKH